MTLEEACAARGLPVDVEVLIRHERNSGTLEGAIRSKIIGRHGLVLTAVGLDCPMLADGAPQFCSAHRIHGWFWTDQMA